MNDLADILFIDGARFNLATPVVELAIHNCFESYSHDTLKVRQTWDCNAKVNTRQAAEPPTH